MAPVATVRGPNGVVFEVDLTLACNAEVQKQIDAGTVELLGEVVKAAPVVDDTTGAADAAPADAPAAQPKPRAPRTRTKK